MKLVYKGRFDGNTESLPHREHVTGAVKFNEADSPKELARRINLASVILAVILFAEGCQNLSVSIQFLLVYAGG